MNRRLARIIMPSHTNKIFMNLFIMSVVMVMKVVFFFI